MIIEEFEVMEDISSELTRTEYLLLGPMCWISHFGPNGHEKRVISLIRVIVCVSCFHGSGRTFSTMGFCGVEVMGSTRTVQMLGLLLLGY